MNGYSVQVWFQPTGRWIEVCFTFRFDRALAEQADWASIGNTVRITTTK